MKLFGLGIVLIALACAQGCGVDGSGPPAAWHNTGAEAVEHKTEELSAGSAAELREHQARWEREGWTVLIVSAPITKPDGTVVRRAELARSQQ
jgi:hypothetical protein